MKLSTDQKLKLSTDQKYFRHVDLWERWKTGNPLLCLQFSGSNVNEKKVIEKEQLCWKALKKTSVNNVICSQFKDQLHALHVATFQTK